MRIGHIICKYYMLLVRVALTLFRVVCIAFDLWVKAWASLYDDESYSAELLYNIYENYYLVSAIFSARVCRYPIAECSDLYPYVTCTCFPKSAGGGGGQRLLLSYHFFTFRIRGRICHGPPFQVS